MPLPIHHPHSVCPQSESGIYPLEVPELVVYLCKQKNITDFSIEHRVMVPFSSAHIIAGLIMTPLDGVHVSSCNLIQRNCWLTVSVWPDMLRVWWPHWMSRRHLCRFWQRNYKHRYVCVFEERSLIVHAYMCVCVLLYNVQYTVGWEVLWRDEFTGVLPECSQQHQQVSGHNMCQMSGCSLESCTICAWPAGYSKYRHELNSCWRM